MYPQGIVTLHPQMTYVNYDTHPTLTILHHYYHITLLQSLEHHVMFLDSIEVIYQMLYDIVT